MYVRVLEYPFINRITSASTISSVASGMSINTADDIAAVSGGGVSRLRVGVIVGVIIGVITGVRVGVIIGVIVGVRDGSEDQGDS